MTGERPVTYVWVGTGLVPDRAGITGVLLDPDGLWVVQPLTRELAEDDLVVLNFMLHLAARFRERYAQQANHPEATPWGCLERMEVERT